MQRPEKRTPSWEEGLSSLPEDEWAVAESQREMTQDKVKNFHAKLQRPEKWAFSWEEGLNFLSEGEELLQSPKEG